MRTLILSNLEAVDGTDEGLTEDTIAVVEMTKQLIDMYIQAPRSVKISILEFKGVIIGDIKQ